ncbi:MAG: hypothetical protein HY578_04260 [Nitrospinae bacterium]|nr:hypothetical protein [Nitrospinota bacterium]
MINIKDITVTSSKHNIHNISINFSPDTTLKLKIGQVLSGMVLKAINSSNAIVKFNEIEVMANTTKELTDGEPILVKIESLYPQVVMRLLESDSFLQDNKLVSMLKRLPVQKIDIGRLMENLTQIISKNFPDTGSAPEFVKRLRDLVKNFSMRLEEDIQSDSVKNMIRRSGIFYENKMLKLLLLDKGAVREFMRDMRDDMKGQLFMLLKELESVRDKNHTTRGIGIKNPDDIKDLEIGLRNLIRSIESHQAVNGIAHKLNNSFIFQIPYLMNDEVRTLRLYIRDQRHGKGKGKSKEEYYLVLILDLTNTGKLRINVNVRDKNMHCLIHVGKEKLAMFFNKYIPDLVKRLSADDIHATVECTVVKREFLAEEPMQEFFNVYNFQLVDTTV